MNTKQSIINLADNLIRCRGYNAFSFNDIAKNIGIKTSSVHYYFPTKSHLGVAVIKEHVERLLALKKSFENKPPQKKLEAFFSIYSTTKSQSGICLVGSLATDLNTVEEPVKTELKVFAGMVLGWVTEILEEGKKQGIFFYAVPSRTKAIMIITNMLAIVQLTRLTDDKDFDLLKKAIIKELKQK